MRMLGLVASLVLALGCNRAPTSPPGAATASGAAPASGAAQASGAAPGAAAPDAQLTDTGGAKIALASVLHRRAETVVVFYRGFW
jgi:hypothetical protein